MKEPSPEAENVFPTYLRKKRSFVLYCMGISFCVLVSLNVLWIVESDASAWTLVLSVPVAFGVGALTGSIYWAFLGPAFSAGKPFWLQTHPNAPKKDSTEQQFWTDGSCQSIRS
jgi:hypothetical protein